MDLQPTQLRGLWALTQSCARARVSRVCAQDSFVPKTSRNTCQVQFSSSRREVAYPGHFTITTPVCGFGSKHWARSVARRSCKHNHILNPPSRLPTLVLPQEPSPALPPPPLRRGDLSHHSPRRVQKSCRSSSSKIVSFPARPTPPPATPPPRAARRATPRC
jgi:hypothetical protein